MMKFSDIPIYFLLVLLFIGCKKNDEQDGVPGQPVISLESPLDMEYYGAFDTVMIKGSIHDDNSVERILISLNKDANVRVLSTIELEPHVKDFQLNVNFPMNDIHMESGHYYFTIQAFNKVSSSKKFVEINYVEKVKLAIGLYAISTEGNTTYVMKVDTLAQLQLVQTLTGDFQASAINSRDQLLYTMGRYNGNLNAFDLNTDLLAWQKKALPGPEPFFLSMSFNNRKVFYALNSGEIRGLDFSGVTVFDGDMQQGYKVENLINHEDKVITVERNFTSGQRILVVYEETSGVVKHSQIKINSTAALFSLDKEHILLFTNKAGGQEILSYNVEGNFFEFQKATLTLDSILDVTKGFGSTYFFSTKNDIFSFNSQDFSVGNVGVANRAQGMSYNEKAGMLWICTDNKLMAINPSNGALIRLIPNNTGTLRSAHVQYDK